MIQYLTNETGQKTAVMVPISEWEDIISKLEKHNILDSVRRGYLQMIEMEKQGVKGKTREELIQSLLADNE